MKGLLAGLDGNLHPILDGRQWTAIGIVVGAVRIVEQVEINLNGAVVQHLRLQVASGTVGFLAGGRIAQRQEEITFRSLIDRQLGRPVSRPVPVSVA